MNAINDLLRSAISLHNQGRLDEAEARYRSLLDYAPGQFDAQHLLGVVVAQRGNVAQGVDLIARALQAKPDDVPALGNHANLLQRLGRHDEALAAADRGVALAPGDVELHNTRGLALLSLRRTDDALAAFRRGLEIDPRHVPSLANEARALQAAGRMGDSLASAEQALALDPKIAPAWFVRARALASLGRVSEALGCIDRALALDRGNAAAHQLRGELLRTLQRPDDALHAFRRAVEADPKLATAWALHGHLLHAYGHNEAAQQSFAQAAELDPGYGFAVSMLSLLRLYNCDWSTRAESMAALAKAVREGTTGIEPFPFLVQSDSPAEQKLCAEQAMRRQPVPAAAPLCTGPRPAHDRIRVAFLSADFREHATTYLVAELIERLGRARFEVVGVSWSADEVTGARKRIRKAFDEFVDVREWGDEKVARWLDERGIDVVVDLNGLVNGARPGICAHRPAPVQVSFLGYPGTCGSVNYDYIVADATVIPPGEELHYTEAVARLPDCYQPNDRQRPAPADVPPRSALGLPEQGFVFCAMNAAYKINPPLWRIWMRLLEQVEGSVLWLLDPGPTAQANLRREAQALGVAPERLVFAPRAPMPQYLARMARADLFLDTLPCSAHTTASDALWAGLPVLTCLGHTFAGRVAGSIVRAAGLPELVVQSLDQYEALALHLARHPHELAALRTRLAQRRADCALFDTERYRRHFEAALVEMHRRAAAGARPAGFDVPRIA